MYFKTFRKSVHPVNSIVKRVSLTLLLFFLMLFVPPERPLGRSDEPNTDRYRVIKIQKTSGIKVTKTIELNIEEYFNLEPSFAATKLKDDAIKNGVDIFFTPTMDEFIINGNNPYKIKTYGADFVPREKSIEPSLIQSLKSLQPEGDNTSNVVCLLQTTRLLSLSEYISLFEKDVKIYFSMSPFTFVVRTPSHILNALLDLPYIRWLGEYKSSYKYDSRLSITSPTKIYIVSLEGDKQDFRKSLADLDVWIRDYYKRSRTYFVEVGPNQVSQLANLWWVKSIHKRPTYSVKQDVFEEMDRKRLNNTPGDHFDIGDSRRLINAWKNYYYDGDGITIGVRDDGLDEDHSAIKPVIDSRTIEKCYHGTHVSGIAMDYYYGVAKDAAIDFQSFDYDTMDTTGQDLFDHWYEQGIYLSNHSYDFGDSLPDEYVDQTAVYDRVADLDNHIIIAAQGNTEQDEHPTNLACGKNLLAVGSVTYVTQTEFSPNEEIGRHSGSVEGPTYNSNNSTDKRLKPDLVAPGGGDDFKYGVVSCRSAEFCDPCEEVDPCFQGEPWDPDITYTRMSGSSMAAPHVAGAAALVAHWHQAQYFERISSELLKALLINTTIPIKDNTWQNDTDIKRGFVNTKVGYGLVNPFSCMYQVYVNNYDYERVLMAESNIGYGGVNTHAINLPTNSHDNPPDKLIVTLVYDDDVEDVGPYEGLYDKLELEIWDGLNTHEVILAEGVTTPSNIQKIVIPNPDPEGTHTAWVSFTETKGSTPRYQNYAIVADVIFGKPELEIYDVDPTITVEAGEEFDVDFKVRNIGYYIAAGVNAKITSTTNFGGDCNKDAKYLDNLYGHLEYTQASFHCTGYHTPGTYTITVQVDGINKDFDPPVEQGQPKPYPKKFDITVNVIIPEYSISGHVKTSLAGYVPGVMINVNPGNDVETGTDGYYELIVQEGWSGTITPELEGYTFTPASTTFVNVHDDIVRNFTVNVPTFTISGIVTGEGSEPVEGIIIEAVPDGGITLGAQDGVVDQVGNYGVLVDSLWSGTIRPQPTSYYNLFDPEERPYSDIETDITDQNYTAMSLPWSEEFGIPICTAGEHQMRPQLVPDGEGGTIITWDDDRHNTCYQCYYPDIYAQRVDAEGNVLWMNNGVAICVKSGRQENPQIVADGNGGAIITWEDERSSYQKIFVQKIDQDGNVLWEEDGILACDLNYDMFEPQITTDGAGGAVIVWYIEIGDDRDTYAQRVDASGNILWSGGGKNICLENGNQRYPQIVSDGQGGVIITWEDNRYGKWDVFAQKIDGAGNLVWIAEGARVCKATGNQNNPQLVSDGAGGAIITWIDDRDGNNDIYVQRMHSDGWRMWGGADGFGIPVRVDSGDDYNVQLAHDMSCGAVLTWQSKPASQSYYSVFTQKVDENGNILWESGGLKLSIDKSAFLPQVASDGMGGALVSWVDNRNGWSDIFAQMVDSQGNIRGPLDGLSVCTAQYRQTMPQIISDDDGNAMIVWQDGRNRSYCSPFPCWDDRYDIYTKKVFNGPRIIKPNGGQEWAITSKQMIKWIINSDESVTHFELGYLCGENYHFITTCDASTREYEWRVTGPPCYECRIKVTAHYTDGSEFYGTSRDPFITYYALSVISPNGGEKWAINRSHTIDWEFTDNDFNVDHFQVGYYVGTAYNELGTCAPDITEYPWTPVSIMQNCLVEIKAMDSFGNPVLTDSSDSYFETHTITAWQLDGLPIVVEPGTHGNLMSIEDGSGGMILTWEYYAGGGYEGERAIYSKRVDKNGNNVWGPVQVREPVENPWLMPQICPDGEGGVYVTWSEDRRGDTWMQGVYAQHVSKNGSVLWPVNGIMVCDTSASQWYPQITTDGMGGAIIAFADQWVGLHGAIMASRVGPDGTLMWGWRGKLVWAGETAEGNFTIVSDGAGGAIVLLRNQYNDLCVERINPLGNCVWYGVTNVCTEANDQFWPRMVGDGQGGAIMAWYDCRVSDNWYIPAIYAQRVNSDGEMQWTTNGILIAAEHYIHYFNDPLTLIKDSSGGAVVAWHVLDAYITGQADAFTQRVDLDGNLLWGDGVTLADVGGDQHHPQATRDGSGGFIFTWEDGRNGWNIYAQRLDASGEIQWDDDGEVVCMAANDQRRPTVVEGAIIAWHDRRTNEFNDIYADRILDTYVSMPLPECTITWKAVDPDSGQPTNDSTMVVACPAGDFDALKVYIQFDPEQMTRDIAAEEITLDKPQTDMVSFWNEGPIYADGPATAANGYTTTITHEFIGGCTVCSDCEILNIPVRLNGDVIGTVDTVCIKGPDRNGDGHVDLSDLSFMGQTYNKCEGADGYDTCLDMNNDDCVNLSDYAYLGEHYNHSYPEDTYPMAEKIAESNVDVKLLLRDQRINSKQEKLFVTLRLENAEDVSCIAIGLEKRNKGLRFENWNDNNNGISIVAPVTNYHRDVLFICALDMELRDGVAEIGTIEFTVTGDNTEVSLKDEVFNLVVGEILDSNGTLKRIKGVECTEQKPVYRNYLANNYPNPFNPMTTIVYSIEKDAQVNLSIYNVNGQLVRTIVSDFKKKGVYKIEWDGTNGRGYHVASGVYFYRIKTDTFTKTKKMVLLR